MIFYKAVYGAIYNVAYGEAEALCCLFNLLCKVHSYASYYVYGQP